MSGAGGERQGSHPRHALAPLLTSPVRLSVVAALAPLDKAEFSFVRDLVEVSDSVLSKQVAALEEAGWVTVEKGRIERRPRTWLRLSDEGRTVYRQHLAALRAIAGDQGLDAPA
ncbi:transcriptional regulator [Streptomyces sp. NBC_00237]|uniref:winged helix-turn-helix domain-containing protein n=1 Tax=Streptomyces sp. NBC_00237 TaxID=2975687 RepID=UPI0022550BEB|nr:transcriptional regulator [Streptomyces sp. NBC_00237]MCX5206964.1 transcriptional regulator [Streptomyces sp. NBC_00237]